MTFTFLGFQASEESSERQLASRVHVQPPQDRPGHDRARQVARRSSVLSVEASPKISHPEILRRNRHQALLQVARTNMVLIRLGRLG